MPYFPPPDTGGTPKRLAGPAALPDAPATLYTAPAGLVAIVRDVLVCNTTGAAATLFLSVGADAAGTRFFSGASVPANTTVQLACFLVLAAGEVLQGWSGTADALTVTISGSEVAA